VSRRANKTILELKEEWAQYRKHRRVARLKIQANRKRELTRAMAKAAGCQYSNAREFWRYISKRTGRGRTAIRSIPVVDPRTGKIALDPKQECEAWAYYYQKLATPEPVEVELSEDERWHRCMGGREELSEIPECDTPLRDEEIYAALQHMKNHKAPGEDGVPVDMLKWILCAKDSAFARAVCGVTRKVWKVGIPPTAWCSSVVVSIPKQGDLTYMEQYRGISLMQAVMKIVMAVVAMRISKGMESLGRFSESQAGFRSNEECVTQVACLVDILQRRKIEEKTTALCFVDLRKAYDTVPHWLLLRKLRYWGIRGHLYELIKGIYASSYVKVRAGGAAGMISEMFQLLRGLRQGCPASPVLFNIFINDILMDIVY
jgi:hypothetical protein